MTCTVKFPVGCVAAAVAAVVAVPHGRHRGLPAAVILELELGYGTGAPGAAGADEDEEGGDEQDESYHAAADGNFGRRGDCAGGCSGVGCSREPAGRARSRRRCERAGQVSSGWTGNRRTGSCGTEIA